MTINDLLAICTTEVHVYEFHFTYNDTYTKTLFRGSIYDCPESLKDREIEYIKAETHAMEREPHIDIILVPQEV